MLELAILAVLSAYPNETCGSYKCGAYDTCEAIYNDAPDDIRKACDIVTETDEDDE